jgi:hypothetical protein
LFSAIVVYTAIYVAVFIVLNMKGVI